MRTRKTRLPAPFSSIFLRIFDRFSLKALILLCFYDFFWKFFMRNFQDYALERDFTRFGISMPEIRRFMEFLVLILHEVVPRPAAPAV
jgi:hypothetical protein